MQTGKTMAQLGRLKGAKRIANCACRGLLLRRLFSDFSAVSDSVSAKRPWGPMELAVLLGIAEEHAIVLLRMGLVEEAPGMPWAGADQVSTATVLRFLERDGAWLALLRLEQQIVSLRARLARERPRQRRTGRRTASAGK